jgi:signal-transduction protein with cAMP-binding, CBS, and nucleotidyltransferase domain
MNVGSLAWPWVASVSPTDPLERAVWRMREFDVGCVAVVEDGELVGIVTERDLLRAASDGIGPRNVIVRDYMTYDPVTVSIDEDVVDAAAIMTAVGARHLPVLDGDEVVGMLSIRDLLPVMSNGRIVNLMRRRAISGRHRPPRIGKRALPDARF